MTGEDAAVDIGARPLRQRIGGVPAVEQWRDAGRADIAVEEAILVDDRLCRLVGGIGGQRGHRLAHFVAARGARFAEKALGRVGHFDRKFIFVDPRQRPRELIDRIVAHRHRAVAARVSGFEAEIGEGLFADLHRLADHMALAVAVAATAFVKREFGVDQVALVRRQPFGAVEGPVGFLAAGQRQLDGALRLVSFLPEADQRVGPDRRLRLVVERSAAIEIAVFLDHLERVALPVGTFRLDNVDMRDEQDRLGDVPG